MLGKKKPQDIQGVVPRSGAVLDHFVNGHPLAGPFPEATERAIFAMGCFWGAERVFWQVPGVWVTAVGYSGGRVAEPSYERVCTGSTGHAESVLVVFDPRKVSYEELLGVFWENHDPTQGMRQGNDVGTQYRSAVFTGSDAQQQAAGVVQSCIRRGAPKGWLPAHNNRGHPGRAVLLCRGLPPAVPGQEPSRLLRTGRHRRLLPGGRGSPAP